MPNRTVGPSKGAAADQIRVVGGRRPVNESVVLALMESIREVGLLAPLVTRWNDEDETEIVVAGRHRFEACRRLGWQHIPTVDISEVPGAKQDSDPEWASLLVELTELDENLCRAELTVLEHSHATARRKDIYERLHPETKQGGDKKSPEAKAKNQTAESATRSFVSDTAAKTGRSERSVRVDAQIGAGIKPETAKVVEGTPVENRQQDLLELAREKDPVRQVEKAKAKVEHARAPKPQKPPPKPAKAAPVASRRLVTVQQAWLALPEKERDVFRKALNALDTDETMAFIEWIEA
jgi:ParB family chromosome partitioning protein